MQEDQMDRSRSVHGRDEKYIQNFGQRTSRES